MSLFSWLLEPSAASVVRHVNELEPRFAALDDLALRAKTDEFMARLAKGEKPARLVPEAFAAVREAARRTLGMRHFDVQILGGVELARGKLLEMKTGEGKTLVATLPAYLHALYKKGVHVITVNDYLAARDAEWMGPIYRALGLSVGVIQENMADDEQSENELRRKAYAADITYVTNSEVVFDFLRDNLVPVPEEIVQRGFHFAIVDEMDLLLIDEAQTPLIISGKGEDDTGLFITASRLVRTLKKDEHFKADRRTRTAGLTESGQNYVEHALNVGSLSAPANLAVFHALHQCLQAHAVYERDVDYIVEDGNVYLVDEHTGRVSPDKRFSNGLHQALEAKENVAVKSEDTTLAKTSYQQFFRSYPELCGMTGTAYSERDEFLQVYNKRVLRLPTHKPMIRQDYKPILYKTLKAKHRAVLAEVRELHELGRPVLLGTVSVRESEELSELFTRAGLPHNVLNAKQHAKEAQVVAQAGRFKAITISTNMAGRGTDIALGGNPQSLAAEEAEPGSAEYEAALARYGATCQSERERVVAAGGLAIIGTGEHESERIDDQLRGRAGRQGDPGSSIFYLSLDDPVYRKFGDAHGLPELREHLADWPEDEPITAHGVFSELHELRQKVEIENQAIRTDVLKYDLVIHSRREAVWGWRKRLLFASDAAEWRQSVTDLIEDLVRRVAEEIAATPPEGAGEDGETAHEAPSPAEQARAIASRIRGLLITADSPQAPNDLEDLVAKLNADYDARYGTEIDDLVREWERRSLLTTIDRLWPQFLTDLERVEEGIGLRGYGNLDPVTEFRREAALLFNDFMRDVQQNALRAWLLSDPHRELALASLPQKRQVPLMRQNRREAPEPKRASRAIDKLPGVGKNRHRKRG